MRPVCHTPLQLSVLLSVELARMKSVWRTAIHCVRMEIMSIRDTCSGLGVASISST